MQEAEIYRQLTAIFCEVFMRADMALRPELTAKDVPGWDSFKLIEIIITLEEQFCISFSTQDLEALQTVGDLVQAIRGKIEE